MPDRPIPDRPMDLEMPRPDPSATRRGLTRRDSTRVDRSSRRWLPPPRALAATLLVALAAAGCAVEPSPRVSVRLLAFNDFHGHLEPGSLSLNLPDPARPAELGATLRVAAGGAAHLAGTLNALRAGQAHTLTVSGGDLVGASPLVSALFRDEPTIEVMNAMRLDLNTVGNHEFDQGLAELRRLADGGCHRGDDAGHATSCADPAVPYAGARFGVGRGGRGFLAANVVDARGEPVFPPFALRTFGGHTLGIVGVVTRSTPTIVQPAGVAGLRFLDEVETLNRHARELRARGVEALVAVVHEGGQIDGDWNDTRCLNARGPIFDIVAGLDPAYDVVFSGHSHTGFNCVIGRKVVMQATAFGRGVSVVDLTFDPLTGDVDRSRTTARNVPVVHRDNPPAVLAAYPPAAPDPQVQRIVERYAALAAPRAQRVIARLAGPLTRQPEPGSGGDHALGRLIADAHLAAAADPARGAAVLAFTNPGGVRADLPCAGPPCDLSFGQAFGVQPFGNSLVVMTLTGVQLKALLEQQASGVNAQRPRILQPSRGFTYVWTATAPEGQRATDLRLNGRLITPGDRLRVVVNSFLAEGGDGFTVLRDGTERLGGAQDLDALVAHVQRSAGPIVPDTTPRVVAR